MRCPSPRPDRRVAAMVLPELACELALRAGARAGRAPLGVVVLESGSDPATLGSTTVLDAVNASARALGVQPGQTLAEARALSARLAVHPLAGEEIEVELGCIAEAALAFGAPAAVQPSVPGRSCVSVPDTVWLDTTGSAHLFGGESALRSELFTLVHSMGHVVRVATASGPRLAQALARWSPAAGRPELIGPLDTAEQVHALPVVSLPIDRERASWLTRVGVLTLGDLAGLPRAAAAGRLGEAASEVLDLCAGRDPVPLVAHEPARRLAEEVDFDEPVPGSQPLLFALRGLAFRISARLAGRGEAAQVLTVEIEHDRSIARLQQAEPVTRLRFDLGAALWKDEDLYRVVGSRLDRTELAAPTVGLRLEATGITRAAARQLELVRVGGGPRAAESEPLPVLLAELTSDLGPQRVGVLECVDSHRPEARSRLTPASEGPARRPRRREGAGAAVCFGREPTRLLSPPVALPTELRVGATVTLDHHLYSIERIGFEQRLDATEWWSASAVSRDYLRLWLAGDAGGLEALVFVDRESGARFLQGVAD